jgi:hypothetical protein
MTAERHEKAIKHIHEGKYVADAQKLERARHALRRGDILAVVKDAKVFELLPLAGE